MALKKLDSEIVALEFYRIHRKLYLQDYTWGDLYDALKWKKRWQEHRQRRLDREQKLSDVRLSVRRIVHKQP